MTVTIVRGPYTVKALELRRMLRKLPRRSARELERVLILRLSALPPHPTIRVGATAEQVREVQAKIDGLIAERFGPGEWSAAFVAFDRDRDGHISRSELRDIFAEAGVGNFLTRGAWTSGVLDALDKDRDGRVSWDELQAVLADRRDPHIIQLEPTYISAVAPDGRDWLLDLANSLDSAYEKAGTSLDQGTLAIANELDAAHEAVADELERHKPAIIGTSVVMTIALAVALYVVLKKGTA